MGSKWNYETTAKFIQQYKMHECLWNFSSSSYKNKHERDAAILAIANAMCIDNFGAAEVKNKIKNLRSTYMQEKKKIAESKRSGAGMNNVYVSSIRWLNEMEKVFANDLKKKPHENIDLTPAVSEMQPEQNLNVTQEKGKEAESTNNSVASTPRPKKRSREILQAINTLSALHEKVNNGEDETLFDIFGKSVAMQLSKLSMENALLAQQKIQSILTEIGIKDYREKNGTATSISNQCVVSIPSVQSNYAESCNPCQLRDESLSSIKSSPYIKEEVITADNTFCNNMLVAALNDSANM